MSQSDKILEQIDHLPLEELRYFWQQLQLRLKRTKLLEENLPKIMGSGSGLWDIDAQSWVDESRADNR